MMPYDNGFAKKIQDALGIEGEVRRIVIDIKADDVVMVHVERYMEIGSDEGLVSALAEHRDKIRVEHSPKVDIRRHPGIEIAFAGGVMSANEARAVPTRKSLLRRCWLALTNRKPG